MEGRLHLSFRRTSRHSGEFQRTRSFSAPASPCTRDPNVGDLVCVLASGHRWCVRSGVVDDVDVRRLAQSY
jgi:hypothetical protein